MKKRSPASDWAWRHTQCKGSAAMAYRALLHIINSPTVTDEAKEQAYVAKLEVEKLTRLLAIRVPFT